MEYLDKYLGIELYGTSEVVGASDAITSTGFSAADLEDDVENTVDTLSWVAGEAAAEGLGKQDQLQL